jgi:hypothetical protein
MDLAGAAHKIISFSTLFAYEPAELLELLNLMVDQIPRLPERHNEDAESEKGKLR